jgi:hypothetical protein
MEVFPMQPGPNSEDINTILSRFHTWAEKQPANGNGNGHKNGAGQLRELSYEEAILQHRRSAQTPRRTKNAAPAEQKSTAKAVPPALRQTDQATAEAAPDWIANLPVVPDAESVETPRIAAAPTPAAVPENTQAQPALAFEESSSSNVPEASPQPSPAKRAATPKVKSQAPKQTAKIIAAAPEIPAAVIGPPTLTAAPLVPRPKRKASSKQPLPKIAAAAPIPAATTPIIAVPITAGPPAKAPKTAAKSAGTAQTKVAAKSPTQKTVFAPKPVRKSAANKTRKTRRPPFRQALAKSVQQPTKKPAPDRTRRITTRFSPAEERRIEKQAADLGINISAYLRQCALAASAAQNTLAPAVANAVGNKKARKPESQAPAESRLYYAPSGSFLGGWLALLRNRFLGPPARFSEEA